MQAVRSPHRVAANAIVDLVIADGMDGGGIDHPPGAMLPRAFEDAVGAANVAVEDLLPGAFQRRAAHMHDGIASFGCGLVGQVKDLHFFMRPDVLAGHAVDDAQCIGQGRKPATLFSTQTPCNPGDGFFLNGFVIGSPQQSSFDTAAAMRSIARPSS